MGAAILSLFIFSLIGVGVCFLLRFKTNSNLDKFAEASTESSYTAEQVCSMILTQSNCQSVTIGRTIDGDKSNYNPSSNVLSVADNSYGKSTIFAVGTVAHECGHASQQVEGSAMMPIRTAFVPVIKYVSLFAFPVAFLGFIIGLFAGGFSFINVGSFLLIFSLAMYCLCIIFSLILLPVEVNASSRATYMLRNTALYSKEELAKIRKVLFSCTLNNFNLLISFFLFVYGLIKGLIDKQKEA